jgi:hypothetical protein
MLKIRVNRKSLFVNNTVFGIGAALLCTAFMSLPALAGAQSLLDPYAEVHPNGKVLVKPGVKKLVKHKEPTMRQEIMGDNGSDNSLAESPNEQSGKTKSSNAKINKADSSKNPGFFVGIKEMQQGCFTSVKAAGSGIVNGSKSAGAKVAAGTRAVGNGMMAAGHKVIPHRNLAAKPKTQAAKPEKSKQIAESLPTNPNYPSLPGRPLDQVVAAKNEEKRLKDKPVTEQMQKPSIVANTFSKLNFLHKGKKNPAPNMTAANPDAVAR